MSFNLKNIFDKPFFKEKKYIIGIWFLLATVSSIKQFLTHDPFKYNNYLIFKNVFLHAQKQISLYLPYPQEYFDHNHYGPIFSLIIAPFALLPDYLGMLLWSLFNTFILIWAIQKLPLKQNQIVLILWICAQEFLTTILSFQFNPIMAAIIILAYVFIISRNEIWSAFVIMTGFLVKLYGIVGLAFFFFSKQKSKFIFSLIFWFIVLFLLPMFISSPQYIFQSYVEWFERLVVKNSENASLTSMQDISFMGVFRKVTQNPTLSNLPFLLFGLFFFALPYLKISAYKLPKFQLLLLSSVLIFTVIFSSGSESPTYIIAMVGVAIWFVIKEDKVSKFDLFLLLFAIILTSFSPSDLIPRYVRENFIRPYGLKALPCVLIWFKIVFEMLTLHQPKENKVVNE